MYTFPRFSNQAKHYIRFQGFHISILYTLGRFSNHTNVYMSKCQTFVYASRVVISENCAHVHSFQTRKVCTLTRLSDHSIAYTSKVIRSDNCVHFRGVHYSNYTCYSYGTCTYSQRRRMFDQVGTYAVSMGNKADLSEEHDILGTYQNCSS